MIQFGNYEARFSNNAWDFYLFGDKVKSFRIVDLFPSGICDSEYCKTEHFAEQIYHSFVKSGYNRSLQKEASAEFKISQFNDNELKMILSGMIDHMPTDDNERVKIQKMAGEIKSYLIHRSPTVFDNVINYLASINKDHQDPRIAEVIERLDNVRFLD